MPGCKGYLAYGCLVRSVRRLVAFHFWSRVQCPCFEVDGILGMLLGHVGNGGLDSSRRSGFGLTDTA